MDSNNVTTKTPAADGIDKVFSILASLVAVALCAFHLLAASPFLTLNNTEQSVYHGALIIAFFLLVKSGKSKLGKPGNILLIALTAVAAHEVIILRNSNVATTMLYTDFQKIVSVLFVCAAIYIAYRALGSILPGLCLAFLVYTFYGSYLPGALETSRVSVYRMATYLMVSSEGLFGSALNVAAIYIFLFVLFGSVLSFIGAGEFFVDIASAAFGHFVGGPAQAAVYSSMLLGMVNGSGAATVVTAGTFTIPLMKKTGFDNDTAGGIVATAASGRQIMPPVMGAAAFLMAEFVGCNVNPLRNHLCCCSPSRSSLLSDNVSRNHLLCAQTQSPRNQEKRRRPNSRRDLQEGLVLLRADHSAHHTDGHWNQHRKSRSLHNHCLHRNRSYH